MDTLSALTVAGNILRFVQFAFELLNNAQKIHLHAHDAADDDQYIEGVHNELLSFSAILEATLDSDDEDEGFVKISDAAVWPPALAGLVQECHVHCEKLLSVTRNVQVKEETSVGWGKSFEKALYEMWKKEDIDFLRGRLRDCQTEIVTQLCAMSAQSAKRSHHHLHQLISETHLSRSERIDQFTRLDQKLGATVKELDSINQKVLSPDGNGITRPPDENELNILTTVVSELTLQERKYAREENVLASLNFDQRPVRHDAIPDAHTRSFRWIFSRQSASESEKPHGFVTWLEKGDGIYWVSGKPGSGKSTLMKFIANNHHTRSSLSAWAGSARVVVASHFFWNSGTSIQRSRSGLLRTLLYDVLSQMPEIIPVICEKRWTEADSFRMAELPWSTEELLASLRRLATAKQSYPVRFCFFIDGLDEYEGDSIDICKILVDLCDSDAVKMCISSRPWDAFESYFGQTPGRKIYVHDLTREDIQDYVKSELTNHPTFPDRIAKDARLQALTDEITNRAQGVFLWVFLVIRHLREGLINDDSLEGLWTRLDSIPTDLEGFFKLILESVNPEYHDQQARTLRIALTANGPLSCEVHCFHELEYADANYALNQPLRVFGPDERRRVLKPLAKRLHARCKGLLEIQKQNVDFLHRTVRDFLRTGEMTTFLNSRTNGAFNPNLSILKAHLAWLKTVQFKDDFPSRGPKVDPSFLLRLSQMLGYAYAADSDDEECQKLVNELLDDLEMKFQLMVMTGQLPTPRPDEDKVQDPSAAEEARSIFRRALIEKDLAKYIAVKLLEDPYFFDDIEDSPLIVALRTCAPTNDKRVNDQCSSVFFSVDAESGGHNQPVASSLTTGGSVRTLQLLLQQGHDPNKYFVLRDSRRPTTPWEEFMSLMAPWSCSVQFETPLDEAHEASFIHALTSGVFSSLLRHGADPNAKLANWRPRKPGLGGVKMSYTPGEKVSAYLSQGEQIEIMEFNEAVEDPAPTVAVVWVFLGLKCPNLWSHGDHYLRELKAMIQAGADFSGLANSGRFLKILELVKQDGSVVKHDVDDGTYDPPYRKKFRMPSAEAADEARDRLKRLESDVEGWQDHHAQDREQQRWDKLRRKTTSAEIGRLLLNEGLVVEMDEEQRHFVEKAVAMKTAEMDRDRQQSKENGGSLDDDLTVPFPKKNNLNNILTLLKRRVSFVDRDDNAVAGRTIASKELVRGSRWGVFLDAIRGTGEARGDDKGSGISQPAMTSHIGEQMFIVRILAELAKTDAFRGGPEQWERDVEPMLNKGFPPNLSQMVMQAVASMRMDGRGIGGQEQQHGDEEMTGS